MTAHVFIGVGPANLHRALKIQKIDPQAKLVFIDNRIQLDTRDINRERARANIFRFSSTAVKDKLIAAGIREEDLLPLIHERDFDVHQGFQFGDDTFFGGDGRFTQIQIRDLQLLFMRTMDRIGGEHNNQPILIQRNINIRGKSFRNEIAGILDEQGITPEEMENLKIHVATGALTGIAEQNEIIYPDKAHYQMLDASDDVEAMPVVPVHGTTTFVITGKIALDQLKDDQRSLDLSSWEGPLKAFGWNLIRPPRIRVFYANDILYIGTEIPIQMNNIKSKEEFEKQVTEYTRTIARLVFPHLDIDELPVNPFLRSRFPTDRGEMGDVLQTTIGEELHSAHSDTT
jgi:hypothetical protein